MNRLAAPLTGVLSAVDASWLPLVEAWRESAAGQSLISALDARLAAGATVFPERPLRALELTPRHSLRAVIVGQDPYHQPGQAEGLAFSVPAGVAVPPSLRNVFGELRRDLGLPIPPSGQLSAWARRGVLLLNTTLTVEKARPASHCGLGWEALTDEVIRSVAQDLAPKVFLLWGSHAHAKATLIAAAGLPHLTLRCNHPSSLSATRAPIPFIGCGHFSRANAFLITNGCDPVDWSLG